MMMKLISELPSNLVILKDATLRHYRNGTLDWRTIFMLSFAHFFGIWGIFRVAYVSKETLIWSYLLHISGILGIDVGVHRLWSHKSYEAHFLVRFFLMTCYSLTNQYSILRWAQDHRVHHRHSDTKADPSDATKGLFFSHFGWLLVLKSPEYHEAAKHVDMSDLYADPVVMFQEKFYDLYVTYVSLIFPVHVAYCCWGEDPFNAFVVAGCLRLITTLHITLCINSVSHMTGDHPYFPESLGGENPLINFIALGEGWHNYHHKYPYDYAAAEGGVDTQFNPAKSLIDFFAVIGGVTHRKRATTAWAMRRARVDREGLLAPPKKVDAAITPKVAAQ